MSRQRIRASVLESSTDPCPHCGGTGHVRSVSSVALQLLRGLEEILMKGATHNLVVRTRTDVALYVLNHKRGHLRDLENSFKVTLSIIADQTVSGPQSYIIDRGEQVHTLEAAKALLAAQATASPPPSEETYEDEELPFDIETESEIETEETEGLAEEQAAGEGASEQDGQRRKRRRRRRGRGSAPREGELREDTPPTLPEPAMIAGEPEEEAYSEQEGEEPEEQQGLAPGEQQGGGERRRRRGRRGGRRRRGGPEEGLAGSIADELSANAPPEASEAVADFDGLAAEASPPIAHTETAVQPPAVAADEQARPAQVETQVETQAESAVEAQAEPAPAAAATEEPPPEGDKASRRRSTVREKVSFLPNTQPEPAAPVAQASTDIEPPAAEPAPEAASEPPPQPRRAGWWSRRFGGGE
jgi:ribonuclease E